jgi:CRP/FNR family transcriptional regulator, cyclic AMP receptor protein
VTQKNDVPAQGTYTQLRRGTWFGSLPPSLAKTLLEAGRSEEYQAGEVIYPEGSPAQGLFAVLDGAVHFEKLDRAGHRVLLHVAPPGFWFGEIATGGGERTMVTARCYTRVVVWRVPVFVVSRILSSEPELFSALSQLMAARFSALIETVCAMRRPTALAQIAGRLSLMDEKCKDCDSAVTRSVLQMSQSDLADMTGHARQTVNAAVNKLEHEGLIQVGHRQIEILNSKGLDAYFTGEKS